MLCEAPQFLSDFSPAPSVVQRPGVPFYVLSARLVLESGNVRLSGETCRSMVIISRQCGPGNNRSFTVNGLDEYPQLPGGLDEYPCISIYFVICVLSLGTFVPPMDGHGPLERLI